MPTKAHQPTLPDPRQISRANFQMVARRLADDLAMGTDGSLFVGSGIEYAQSRPYEPGDPVRQLDWKLSAKLGTPYIKEYETLKRIAMHLLVDTSASMAVSSTRLTKHDLAVWLAAAIGLVGLRRLSPVKVTAAGARGRPAGDQPSLAERDLWRALDPLRDHASDETTEVGDALSLLTSGLARRAMIVVLSDLHDPAALPSIKRAAAKHDVITLHLEDPAERAPVRAGFYRAAEAETGRDFLAGGPRITRTTNADLPSPAAETERALTGAGVSYLRLATDEPFIPKTRHFLAARALLAKGRG